MTSPFCCFSTMVKVFLTILCLFYPLMGKGERGVGSDFILFGQSAALSHEARYLGQNMRQGILRAFEEINRQGGIYGRKLKLVSLDDAYEPEQAVKNTRRLLDQHKVFALIGGVGTPTSKAILPIVSEELVPYIGPFTGAGVLRTPAHKSPVINLRASYDQEINYMVKELVGGLKLNRIAILYQDDSYGRAGLSGLKKALKPYGKHIVSEGVYLRNTVAVKIALLRLYEARPEAVVIVGAYKPVARFIRWAGEINFNPVFICLSFVGTTPLMQELKNIKTPVLVTQVMPSPFNKSFPLVKAYQKASTKKDFNFISLEGYLAGKFTGEVLKQVGKNLTRSRFLSVIREKKEFVVDGFRLKFSKKDNQGSDRVFLTSLQNGRLVPLKNLKQLYGTQKNTDK